MTKSDAAKHCNINPRTLERYTAKGRITPSYVRGPKGKEADYKFEDVEQLRQELEAALNGTTSPNTTGATGEATDTTTALARVDSSVERGLVSTRRPRRTKTDTPDINVSLLSLKRLFTLEEAELLTGISKARLRAAIASGDLQAGRDGRSWKVLPSALDAFLAKRFGASDRDDSPDPTGATQ